LPLALACPVDLLGVPPEPPASERLGPVGPCAPQGEHGLHQVGEGVGQPAAQQRLALVFPDQTGGVGFGIASASGAGEALEAGGVKFASPALPEANANNSAIVAQSISLGSTGVPSE